MNRILIISVFILVNFQLFAQPKWHKNPPESSSGKYCYVSVATYNGADILPLALKKSVSCLGISHSEYQRISGSESNGSIEVGNQVFNFKKVREKNIGSTTYVLMMFSKGGEKKPRKALRNPIPLTLPLSIILPGTGQFYKKQGGKGVFYLLSSLGSAGTAYYFHSQFQDDKDKFAIATSFDERESLVSSMEQNRDIRNIALGAAGFVYFLNLVDVVAAKGNRYAYNPNKKFNWDIAYNNQSQTPVLNLRFRFE